MGAGLMLQVHQVFFVFSFSICLEVKNDIKVKTKKKVRWIEIEIFMREGESSDINIKISDHGST